MAWPLALTFVNTDGTVINAHDAAWIEHPQWTGPDPSIASNRLRGGSASPATLWYYSDSPGSADQDVAADLYIRSTTTDHMGVCARVDATASTFYMARYRYATGIQLFKFVGSKTSAQLGSTVAGNYAQYSTLNLRLRCEGTSIKVFADDVEVISVTDADITGAGFAGLYVAGASATAGVHVTNLSAAVVSSGGDINLAAAGAATASGTATIEGGATNVNLAAVGAATASGTADIASSGGVVSISIPVLADFATGVDITDETGVTAIIHDANDGAYVATVTGLAPGATPTALTHASLVDGSLYQVTLLLSGSRRAYLTATASAS